MSRLSRGHYQQPQGQQPPWVGAAFAVLKRKRSGSRISRSRERRMPSGAPGRPFPADHGSDRDIRLADHGMTAYPAAALPGTGTRPAVARLLASAATIARPAIRAGAVTHPLAGNGAACLRWPGQTTRARSTTTISSSIRTASSVSSTPRAISTTSPATYPQQSRTGAGSPTTTPLSTATTSIPPERAARQAPSPARLPPGRSSACGPAPACTWPS